MTTLKIDEVIELAAEALWDSRNKGLGLNWEQLDEITKDKNRGHIWDILSVLFGADLVIVNRELALRLVEGQLAKQIFIPVQADIDEYSSTPEPEMGPWS